MKILGIHAGHDATLAVTDGLTVRAALSKERLTRKKNDDGFFDVKHILKLAEVAPEEIDFVAYGGYCNSNRWFDALGKFSHFPENKTITHALTKRLAYPLFSFQNDVLISTNRRLAHKTIRKNVLRHLRKRGIRAPLVFVDHHLAHAASAYYTSGWDDVLIITADGTGDNLSVTANTGHQGKIKRIHAVKSRDVSLGDFYSSITKLFGFKPNRHEGKITGLAAYGDPNRFYALTEKMIAYDPKKNTLTSSIWKHLSARGKLAWFTTGLMDAFVVFLEEHFSDNPKKIPRKDMEDLAAAFQTRLEDVMVQYVTHFVQRYKHKRICLAGGTFANVKVNQRILEIAGVENVFVHPAMGDSGLAAGAALYAYYQKHGPQKQPTQFIERVALGPEFSDMRIQKALLAAGLKAKSPKNLAREIASRITQGKVIGFFNGRMEYGPRALGSRTILGDPRDKSINDTLNHRLNRTEFMPFAPCVLEEYAHEWFKGWREDHIAARFMTITYDVPKVLAKLASAVVHVDFTARPQVVRRHEQPLYWETINEFRKLTGVPLLINTSFNAHEEPIVCTPEDAIRSFKNGNVDALVLGRWLVE